MASVVNSRRTSDLGDREAVVVFLIGMRARAVEGRLYRLRKRDNIGKGLS